jgi:hypothetical protein
MNAYVPTNQSDHGRAEEIQWARIAATGDARAGMALILIQKLCTAFHEFAPAWERGALQSDALEHFRMRLSTRARRVLQMMEANGLGALNGVETLRDLLGEIEDAESLAALAALSESIHAVNHTLTDALEAALHIEGG